MKPIDALFIFVMTSLFFLILLGSYMAIMKLGGIVL